MAKSLIPSVWDDKQRDGDVFSSLHNEIDRVFDRFSTGRRWPFGELMTNGSKLSPSMNVSETDKDVEVTVELPGVEEKEIDVSLADDVLTIKGEKKKEEEKSEDDYKIVECSYGAFERAIRLPCEVQADKIEANFKNGVLAVKLPKSPEAETKTRKIAVKSA